MHYDKQMTSLVALWLYLSEYLKLMYGSGGSVDSPMSSWVVSLCNAGRLCTAWATALWFGVVIKHTHGAARVGCLYTGGCGCPMQLPGNQSRLHPDKLFGTGIASVSKTLDWYLIVQQIGYRHVNNQNNHRRFSYAKSPEDILCRAFLAAWCHSDSPHYYDNPSYYIKELKT